MLVWLESRMLVEKIMVVVCWRLGGSVGLFRSRRHQCRNHQGRAPCQAGVRALPGACGTPRCGHQAVSEIYEHANGKPKYDGLGLGKWYPRYNIGGGFQKFRCCPLFWASTFCFLRAALGPPKKPARGGRLGAHNLPDWSASAVPSFEQAPNPLQLPIINNIFGGWLRTCLIDIFAAFTFPPTKHHKSAAAKK